MFIFILAKAKGRLLHTQTIILRTQVISSLQLQLPFHFTASINTFMSDLGLSSFRLSSHSHSSLHKVHMSVTYVMDRCAFPFAVGRSAKILRHRYGDKFKTVSTEFVTNSSSSAAKWEPPAHIVQLLLAFFILLL